MHNHLIFGLKLIEFHPKNSGFYLAIVIELQSFDCSAAYSRATNEACFVWIPSEMVSPAITSRIKNSDETFTYNAKNQLFLILVAVTGMTGEREIVQLIAAAEHARHDMIDNESMVEKDFRGATILTAMLGARSHTFVQTGRH